MNPSIAPGIAVLVVALASVASAEPAAVTTASLLREMTDLAGMASFPEPAYSCRQFSSYDRKARSPGEDWFANGDRGQYLRIEENEGRREYVMMDAAGPGAVVRIWSANPAGTLRIYLDRAEEAVIAAPMTDLLGGGFAGLPKPLAGERSKGWNLYFPFAYAKHCKITSDAGDFYYHVNHRTYQEGTAVTTFSADDLSSERLLIDETAGQLAKPAGGRAASEVGSRIDETIQPGAAHSIVIDAKGSALTIPALKLAVADPVAALRAVILKIDFDGEACVEAPLGDFFGSAPGINAYSSLPLGMSADGTMYSHWVMPFESSATIELANLGDQPVRVIGRFAGQPHRWTGRSLHFHAGWRVESEVPTRPMIDWNYLTAKGRGVFAGASFAIDNPVKKWWGEGDEKIYVDGESFPSHFGTGTEDYFGYAWCFPDLFNHAYHSQSRCDGPGNYGRTSVNRFHILDRIPFRESFRFDMELWHWHEHCKVNMAVTAYWYARPGGSDEFPPVTADMAVVRPLEEYRAPRVAGALEGEELKIVSVTGVAEPQEWDGLSNGCQLWWHKGVEPGGKLSVAFPAAKAGRYRVLARFLMARDYGIHQLAVNGIAAGKPIDFFHTPRPVPSDEIELGSFDLKQGENTLSVTATGSHPDALKALMFGLDYLRLESVE